jgi:type IV secretory pathway VirB3-like protein
MLPTRVEIPTGATMPYMVGGIPLEAAAALALVILLPFVMLKTLWGIPLAIPVWSFFRHHAKQDPLMMRLWAGQMAFKSFYRHG